MKKTGHAKVLVATVVATLLSSPAIALLATPLPPPLALRARQAAGVLARRLNTRALASTLPSEADTVEEDWECAPKTAQCVFVEKPRKSEVC